MKRGRDEIEDETAEENGSKKKPAVVKVDPQTDVQEETTAEPASDAAGASANAETEPKAKAQAEGGQQLESEEEDEEEYKLQRRLGPSVKKGSECPYLDTISRQNLDFDFEKCCSVSLSPVNVYACLVCGKYFQGRGQHTHAYTHSLETGHHMFMKLEDGRVYCLPDGYEVVDRSLDVIRFVLNPTFTDAEISKLDSGVSWSRALDGNEYMPGLLGLNNMRHNDYVNVIMQVLSRVPPMRDFFLQPANYSACASPLVHRCGELLRKMWNPRNFKGQVSPHEFMQIVMKSSNKRFTIEQRGDPVEFWSWFLNSLHLALTGGKRKKASVVSRCFQGELEITTEAGSGKAMPQPGETVASDHVERVPFLMLGLDLPPAPLYKDKDKKDIIPQVPIYDLLRKFDGQRVHSDVKLGRRRFRMTKLPQFLVLHVKRFINNRYFTEKNPTIVNFPVKNLELRDTLPIPLGKNGQPQRSKYDLIANVVHDGLPDQGSYRVHMHRKVEDQWYEVENLRVVDILPQVVALSETYMQVYERKQAD